MSSFTIKYSIKATATSMITEAIYVRALSHFCFSVLVCRAISTAIYEITERKNNQIQIADNFSFNVSAHIKKSAVSITQGSDGVFGTIKFSTTQTISVKKI